MAQSNQATPTLQANIAGTNTTVNLRDWLNTRLGPFLKKAIIESFDSEAEFPLQWLGEHLIQQSILFEGNPDATNIQERFRYKHEAKPPRTLVQESAAPPPPPPPQAAPTQPPAPSPQPEQSIPQTVVVPQAQPVQNQVTETANTTTETSMTDEAPEPVPEPDPAARATPTPATNVNGTSENPPDQVQDTEMSNAP